VGILLRIYREALNKVHELKFNYQSFLSLLKAPESRNVVTIIRKYHIVSMTLTFSCKRFIETYRAEYSVKRSVDEQVSMYRQYRDDLAEILQTHPVWIEAGEEAQLLGAEGIEYMTMNQIHSKYLVNLRSCGANSKIGLSVLHIRTIAQKTKLFQRNFTCSPGLNLST
jgi:hypothetical protein